MTQSYEQSDARRKWLPVTHTRPAVQRAVHAVTSISCVQALAAFFIYTERRKGIRTSGYLLIFWLLLLVTGIVIFRSKIRIAVIEVSSETESHMHFGIHSILMLNLCVCLCACLCVCVWLCLLCVCVCQVKSDRKEFILGHEWGKPYELWWKRVNVVGHE